MAEEVVFFSGYQLGELFVLVPKEVEAEADEAGGEGEAISALGAAIEKTY
jgi:hypothetical protein